MLTWIDLNAFGRQDEYNEWWLALVVTEDDEERPSLQQRPTNTSTPTAVSQSMKIILEEDENSESPPAE